VDWGYAHKPDRQLNDDDAQFRGDFQPLRCKIESGSQSEQNGSVCRDDTDSSWTIARRHQCAVSKAGIGAGPILPLYRQNGRIPIQRRPISKIPFREDAALCGQLPFCSAISRYEQRRSLLGRFRAPSGEAIPSPAQKYSLCQLCFDN
jgi:hypothetical protein